MGGNNRIRKFVKPYRVDDGKKFRLKDIDPATPRGSTRRRRRRSWSRKASATSRRCRTSSTPRTSGGCC